MITNIYKYNLIGGNIMNKLKRFMALLCADFNKSTDVTALDAAEVAKYLAEKSIGK